MHDCAASERSEGGSERTNWPWFLKFVVEDELSVPTVVPAVNPVVVIVPLSEACDPSKTSAVPFTLPLTGVETPPVVRVPRKLPSQGLTVMLSVEPVDTEKFMTEPWKRGTSAIAAGTARAAAATVA